MKFMVLKFISPLAVILTAYLILSSPTSSGATDIKIGVAEPWQVYASEVEHSCLALKPFGPGQFNIGIDEKQTWLSFQNFYWTLPSTPTNTMPVRIALDGQVILETDAVSSIAFVLVKARAIQVIMKPTDRMFWQKLFTARSVSISGQFNPGSGTVPLDNVARIIPLMKDCANRYLKGVQVPF